MDFYTKLSPIQMEMKPAWIVILIFVFFDCVQGVAIGNISGLGLISKVKWVTAFDYWVVGIPTSLIGMFTFNLALRGLWLGPTMAVLLNTIFYLLVITNADWQQIADNMAAKMKEDMNKMEKENTTI